MRRGPWPLAGTATWHTAVDRLRSADRGDVEAHFEATVTVTFDGTQAPAVVVAGVYRYQLDLASGTLSRAGW